MTLRGKIAILITLSFVVAAGTGVINQLSASEGILRDECHRICGETVRKFRELLKLRERMLLSVSSLVAQDERVIEGLRRGDWTLLYRGLGPVYEELSGRGLIGEVSVSREPGPQSREALPLRNVRISEEGVKLSYTHPVVAENGVVGRVSVSLDMDTFLREFSGITGSGCGLALREDLVRKSLTASEFERFARNRFAVNGYLIESPEDLDLGVISSVRFGSGGVLWNEENGLLLCTAPLRNERGEILGYFFAYSREDGLALRTNTLKPVLTLYMPVLSLLFISWLVAFGKLSARIERILLITGLLKSGRLRNLESYRCSEPLDEIGRIESDLLELGRRLREHLEEEAPQLREQHRDDLTGTYSLQALRDFGVDLINRHLAVGKPVSVLLVDGDDFGRICELHGPEIRDSLIKELSHVLRETLRDTDFLFRIDGENFLILLPGTSLKGALRVGENLRRKVEVSLFPAGEGFIRLTVSIGITEISKPVGDIGEIIEKVSRALYLAKKTGKNRIAVEE